MSPGDVLDFWFGAAPLAPRPALWWRPDPADDAALRERFGDTVDRALAGGLDDWEASIEGRLALVVVLDQFTRQVHRRSPMAFAGDGRARALAVRLIDRAEDRGLHLLQRAFLVMPFEHSESRVDQRFAVAYLADLVSQAPEELRGELENNLRFARHHREIIERFGRFPHRNRTLGREATGDEAAWLEAGGARFNQ